MCVPPLRRRRSTAPTWCFWTERAPSARHTRRSRTARWPCRPTSSAPDWYSFGEAPAQSGETAGNGDVLGKLGESLLAQTGMPALASLAAQAAGLIQGADGLEDVLESYLTRMDLWIEGYRQNAVLGKLPTAPPPCRSTMTCRLRPSNRRPSRWCWIF